MGRVCQEFHQLQLENCLGHLRGSFQLDELETFETHRLVRPVTMPVLIEKHSYFVVHTEVAPMGPRGRLHPQAQKKKEEDERLYGKRKSGSRQAVQSSLELLGQLLAPGSRLHIQTDRKATYRRLVRQIFADRLGSHVRESSRRRRDYSNVLFPINHTLAMMRDGISRLVRRSWGASKLRSRLQEHTAIWVAYRNYVRGITVRAPRITPAMVLGVLSRRVSGREILAWRWPRRMGGCPAKQASF